MAKTKKSERQDDIVKIYLDLVKEKKAHPSLIDMKAKKVTRSMIRESFDTLAGLRKFAKKYYPEAFAGIIDYELFTPAAFKKLQTKTKKYKRFVVTTAVQGCKVHRGFFNSLKTYCAENDALLLVMLCTDPAALVGDKIDPILNKEVIVFDNLALNSNIFTNPIKLSAKHIDPVTGLGRLGQRNGSFIYASPKQRLKMIPTSNTKPPVALMTTGACTIPAYNSERYLSDRTAVIAHNDHVMGAIIVEVESDRFFHFRQIQSERSGSFIDLDKYFQGDVISAARPEALVLGDWHSGSTDPVAKAATFDQICTLKPRRLIIHDGFDGRSISHHAEKNKILRAQRASKNQLSLEQELRQYAKDLNELVELCEDVEEIVIVESNHDEHLDRYLTEARYVEDPQNHALGLKLAGAMVEGRDPVRAGVEMFGLKYPEKIRWLSRDEDFKIARIELGAHGDKGANGSRGSLRAMEQAYGQSVSGHAHTAEILRGAFQTGTLSLLKMDYNVGPSSWTQTNCTVNKNGSRQLLNIFNGRWRLR
jgi:hypothetical protein